MTLALPRETALPVATLKDTFETWLPRCYRAAHNFLFERDRLLLKRRRDVR